MLYPLLFTTAYCIWNCYLHIYVNRICATPALYF